MIWSGSFFLGMVDMHLLCTRNDSKISCKSPQGWRALLASSFTVNLVLLLGLSPSLVSWWPILLALSLDHPGSIGFFLNFSRKKDSRHFVACVLHFTLAQS